jgi:predicted transcriptional regulator
MRGGKKSKMTARRTSLSVVYGILESISSGEKKISKLGTESNQSYYVLVKRIEKLEKQGLVQHRIQNIKKTDNFYRLISLTEKGQNVLTDLRSLKAKIDFEAF